jgi:hypothetical protein
MKFFYFLGYSETGILFFIDFDQLREIVFGKLTMDLVHLIHITNYLLNHKQLHVILSIDNSSYFSILIFDMLDIPIHTMINSI